jgi:hypothetical protein
VSPIRFSSEIASTSAAPASARSSAASRGAEGGRRHEDQPLGGERGPVAAEDLLQVGGGGLVGAEVQAELAHGHSKRSLSCRQR